MLPVAAAMLTSCQKEQISFTEDAMYEGLSIENGLLKMPGEDYVNPANFITGITNPYIPLEVGDTMFYETIVEEDGTYITEHSYVTVLDEEKIIAGVSCVVVHDVVMVDGFVKEDTRDWYAQDIHGNVWYLGEYTITYDEDGSSSTIGSFEHGVDGATGGLIMAHNPSLYIGNSYKQENYPGIAEDRGKIVAVNETVTIGIGTFEDCVKILEASPLEPGFLNVKYYAPGIGFIYSEVAEGGVEFSELTE
jgi:hypothetical protein